MNEHTIYSKSYGSEFIPKVHSIEALEEQISAHLPQTSSRPIIYAGDALVASKLSESYDVTLINCVPESELAESHGNIRKVVKTDVLDFIYFNASPCLVISYTTTSGWNHSFQLDKLTKAIERNRYKLVLIEFSEGSGLYNKEGLLDYFRRNLTKFNIELIEQECATGNSFTVAIKNKYN